MFIFFCSLLYSIYCFATFRGTYPYIYSSIPVIQIFVTKNTFALFPHSVSILFTFSQLNCVSIRETHTPCFQATNKKTFINVFVFSIESTYKSLQ